jgi:transposase-like protein
MTNITLPIFKDETAAREHLEAIRWPTGPVCPHCGEAENVTRMVGKSHRPGLFQCNSCRENFTVTVGTVMERSHIPLHKWVLAFDLMASSKKGMSAHQLHRMLGITYKSAWFMCHRIRESMRDMAPTPMGGEGKTVEIDETFIGRKKGKRIRRGHTHKHAILSLVERDGGVRSFKLDGLKVRDIAPIVRRNVERKTSIVTDDATIYPDVTFGFVNHSAVNHSAKEWVKRGQSDVHTNTIEGFFSVFKRGMKGVYQLCGEKHLHRYLAEFDFRYNNRIGLGVDDAERAVRAVLGSTGKRLTYQQPARR